MILCAAQHGTLHICIGLYSSLPATAGSQNELCTLDDDNDCVMGCGCSESLAARLLDRTPCSHAGRSDSCQCSCLRSSHAAQEQLGGWQQGGS